MYYNVYKGGEKMTGLIGKKEVALMLNVTVHTVERYMRKKKIPYLKFGDTKSSKVLFKKTDIENYIKNHYNKE